MSIMKYKNTKDFTLDECWEYIKRNPNGRSLSEVQERMNHLLEEEEKKTETKDVFEKPGFSRIQWIDIKQFLEKRKYKNYSWISKFLCIVFGVILVIATLMVNNGVRVDVVAGIFGFPTLVLLEVIVIFYLSSSPVLSRIYNIENTDSKYVVVQNRSGKMGLCRCGRHRLVPLLRFKYEEISPCENDSYICKKENKLGVYNAGLRKMVLPVVYDSIEQEGDDILVVTQNGVDSKFTTKGYRVIE